MNPAAFWTLQEVERAAQAVLDASVWAYVAGGAGAGRTMAGNAAAYDSVWLQPRVCAKPAVRADTATEVLGVRVALPVLLAPTSPQRLLHADAELATARAAAAAGTLAIVSTDSHHPLPAITGQVPHPCWFQLYAYRSREVVERSLELATRSGVGALVVTVDATHAARRVVAMRAGFRTPSTVEFGTLRVLGVTDGSAPDSGRVERLPLTWDDLAWIRKLWRRPLLVKGIVHPQDARRCVELGVEGIIVSNHGGRQLDGTVPTLVALQRVAAEVRGACTLLVDGGVRSGTDVVKAIALGARAACIGRPYLWGLALNGQAGIEAVLDILAREIQDTLLQLGLASIGEVGPDCVVDLRAATEGADRGR